MILKRVICRSSPNPRDIQTDGRHPRVGSLHDLELGPRGDAGASKFVAELRADSGGRSRAGGEPRGARQGGLQDQKGRI